MKNFNKVCLLALSAILIFSGCDSKIYADHSEDIKIVSATYHLVDMMNDKEDRLVKNAELIYTKLYITPKVNLSLSGLSFKAKLKSGVSETFSLRVYASYPIANDISQLKTDRITLNEDEIILTGMEQYFTLSFNNPYNVDFTGFETDKINSYKICVEFLYGSQKNDSIFFAIDNVNLIANS